MIRFVNAKINIGLQVVRRREDGYHDLQTVFYPVGLYAGTPRNPEPFCDVIEVTRLHGGDGARFSLKLRGEELDCGLENNLVNRAAELFFENCDDPDLRVEITLEKHLPTGAGMGGGSADAAFTLKMLGDICSSFQSENRTLRQRDRQWESSKRMEETALRLGADCPFFLLNKAAYAMGVGEILCPIELDLSGKWLLVIKPDVFISTKEAFAGITPKEADFDLRDICSLPVSEWRDFVKNDFEDSIFPRYPFLSGIKEKLYLTGAEYASLTGSGSCLYGIFSDKAKAEEARESFRGWATISASYLLLL